jgi:hypothetical protein
MIVFAIFYKIMSFFCISNCNTLSSNGKIQRFFGQKMTIPAIVVALLLTSQCCTLVGGNLTPELIQESGKDPDQEEGFLWFLILARQ